jgi:hypothetical protein
VVTVPRSQITEEVQVLKFFEEAPLEKAEMLFNIVKEKMRTRLHSGSAPAGTTRAAKNKRSVPNPTDSEARNTETGDA